MLEYWKDGMMEERVWYNVHGAGHTGNTREGKTEE
jgi:hypothetical protein